MQSYVIDVYLSACVRRLFLRPFKDPGADEQGMLRASSRRRVCFLPDAHMSSAKALNHA